MGKLGFYKGRHYTEYVEKVKALKRGGDLDKAEKLLLRLVEAVEKESRAEGCGVAPWYYEQLAIIYRKRRNYKAEVTILERYEKQTHAPGATELKLMKRLEKARKLSQQE
jgi:hypothetical protein